MRLGARPQQKERLVTGQPLHHDRAPRACRRPSLRLGRLPEWSRAVARLTGPCSACQGSLAGSSSSPGCSSLLSRLLIMPHLGLRLFALALLAALASGGAAPPPAATAAAGDGLSLPSRLTDLCASAGIPMDGLSLFSPGFTREASRSLQAVRTSPHPWRARVPGDPGGRAPAPLPPRRPSAARAAQDLGPLRRLQTPTANWGYYRWRAGRARSAAGGNRRQQQQPLQRGMPAGAARTAPRAQALSSPPRSLAPDPPQPTYLPAPAEPTREQVRQGRQPSPRPAAPGRLWRRAGGLVSPLHRPGRASRAASPGCARRAIGQPGSARPGAARHLPRVLLPSTLSAHPLLLPVCLRTTVQAAGAAAGAVCGPRGGDGGPAGPGPDAGAPCRDCPGAAAAPHAVGLEEVKAGGAGRRCKSRAAHPGPPASQPGHTAARCPLPAARRCACTRPPG